MTPDPTDLIRRLESQDWSPKDGELARDPVFLCHEAATALADLQQRLRRVEDAAKAMVEHLDRITYRDSAQLRLHAGHPIYDRLSEFLAQGE